MSFASAVLGAKEKYVQGAFFIISSCSMLTFAMVTSILQRIVQHYVCVSLQWVRKLQCFSLVPDSELTMHVRAVKWQCSK